MTKPRENTIVKIASIGVVELRYLAVGDFTEIGHLIANKKIDDRQFAVGVLHRLLVKPKLSSTKFGALPDAELQKIAKALVKKEKHSFQYFKDTGSIFTDMKDALKDYQLKQYESRAAFSTSFIAAQTKLDAISRSVQRFNKPLISQHSNLMESVLRDKAKVQALTTAKFVIPLPTTMTIAPALELARKQLEVFNKQFGTIAQQALDRNTNIIQQALKGLPSIHSDLAKIKVDMAMPLLSVADQYAKMAQMAMSQLKPQIEFFQDWITKNQRVFDPIWKSWDEIEKKNKIAEKKAAKILRKYKWFICPSMPVTAIRAILKVAKTKGRKDGDINKLFVDYFSRNDWKNLEDMVFAWGKNKLFAPRMPILTNCVKVMQSADKDKCNGAIVVLPTLISQIDGLLSDYLDKHNIPYKTLYGGQVGRKKQFKANAPNALTDDLNELAQDMFLNILFQSSQRGKPLATPFNFNRHKIMHGEIVRFGRKDYLVRAFMVLDFLAFLK